MTLDVNRGRKTTIQQQILLVLGPGPIITELCMHYLYVCINFVEVYWYIILDDIVQFLTEMAISPAARSINLFTRARLFKTNDIVN